jgi:hypothetical protein
MIGNSDEMAVVAIYEDEEAQRLAAEAEAERLAKEEAEVKAWADRIKAGRDMDAKAREGYARDRARCDYTGGGRDGVRVPIAAAYLDVLVSYLYVRDPAMDAQPSKSATADRLGYAKELSKAINAVLAGLWKAGKLKAAARPLVRSALTVGVGWMKAVYLKRTERDPLVAQQINDIQDNLRRIAATQAEIAEGEMHQDLKVLQASLEAQLAGLQERSEVQVAVGRYYDFIPAEDVQVAPECPTLERYLDAPWIAHRVPIPVKDAKSMLPLLDDEQIKTAEKRIKRQPCELTGDGSGVEVFKPEDADAFVAAKGGEKSEEYLFAWEIWDKDAGVVRTWVEGTKRWARPIAPPQVKTRRFYPFLQWAPLQVDGKRHPESLPQRSEDHLDEYNRARTEYRAFRDRVKSRIGFDSDGLTPEEVDRIVYSETAEMVPISTKGRPIGDMIQRIPPPEFMAELYDTGVIRSELELVFGIQEALASSIRTAKTATESEIQDSGTQARLSFYRDSLDEMMIELAGDDAEVALQCMPRAEAEKYAGPLVFWPEGLTVDQMGLLLSLDIRAGSTTKAASGLRQERWTQIAPILKEAIGAIGQLRQSDPMEIADKYAEMVKETLDRFGENIDPERFIPAPGQPVPMIDPTTGQTVLAYPAPMPEAPAGQPMPPAAAPMN